MNELNETLENKDSEKEDLIPENNNLSDTDANVCLLYTSPSPRDRG